MQELHEDTIVPAIKDSGNEQPIASAWRPTLSAIVDAYVRHDYRLAAGISGVAAVSEETADHVQRYIAQYGATLVPLPAKSWETSVSMWMDDHWSALIDLWTEEEGRSDLVLQVHIVEIDALYVIDVHMVYVP